MSISNNEEGTGRGPRRRGFRDDEVADYERRRYRGLDQRLVHGREMRILKRLLAVCSPSAGGAGGTEGGRAPSWTEELALDAPCGYGRFSGLLEGLGYGLVDADLSIAMVRRAVARPLKHTYPIGIVCNVVEGLPFRRDGFSLVFSLRLFHHLHESDARRRALAEFARVSRGWVIVSYYQSNILHLAQRAIRRRVLRKRTRIKMIRGGEFRREAAAAGLTVVRIVPLFRGLHGQHIALLRKGRTGR